MLQHKGDLKDDGGMENLLPYRQEGLPMVSTGRTAVTLFVRGPSRQEPQLIACGRTAAPICLLAFLLSFEFLEDGSTI